MKQYLVSVYNPEPLPFAPDEMEAMGSDVNALNADMQKAGIWVFAAGLFRDASRRYQRVPIFDSSFDAAAARRSSPLQ